MLNKLLLRIVMLFSGVWKGMGADATQLGNILAIKLVMDDRKPMSFGRQRKQKKDIKYATWLSVFFSLLTGFFYLFFLFGIKDPVSSLFMYFTVFLFMLTFTLITDFSNVLFDPKEKYVLLPRPVNDKTIFLARTLHSFIYLFRIVVPMSLPGWVTLGITYGWKSVILFPFVLVLMVFIALFLVNTCYLLLLRVVKAEKFKEAISYFQIAFSILLFAMYYMLPRLMEKNLAEQLNVSANPLLRSIPSYWLAAAWLWIIPGSAATFRWYSLVAVVFPIVCLWITVKWLAPKFAARIGAIDASDVAPAMPAKRAGNGKRPYQAIADFANRNDTVKAGFLMTWLQTSRNRTFKMRIYPAFAYVPIYFVYMFLLKDESMSAALQHLPEKKNRLFVLLYMSTFVLSQAITYVTISDQYKAAWVYYASPVSKPGKIMIGAFKAIWIKYFLPFYSAIAVFALYFWGLGVIPDLILALLNVSLFSLLTMRIAYRCFPFSKSEQINNAGGRTMIRVFLTFFVIGLLGTGHYFASTMLPWLLYVFMALSGILLWLVWDSYANTSWADMATADDQI